jgi:hypothetical protein
VQEPPPLVRRALRLAADAGFVAPADDVARLVHVLAAGTGRRRVGAIGGDGVTAAWVASALEPGVPFVVCTAVASAADVTRRSLGEDADVRVLEGDWQELLPAEAPFDLLVVAEAVGSEGVAAAVGLLSPRGTGIALEPEPAEGAAWTGHPDLATAEVLTGSGLPTMVAVRRL